jgi:hypothetical protein
MCNPSAAIRVAALEAARGQAMPRGLGGLRGPSGTMPSLWGEWVRAGARNASGEDAWWRQNNNCAARAGTTICLDISARRRRRCLIGGGDINAGHEVTCELMRMAGVGHALMMREQMKVRRSGKRVSGRYRAVQGERERGEYREPGRNTFRPVAHNQTLHLGTDSLIRILGH